VLFGQTCTASGDSMRQYAIGKSAHPKRTVIMDIECDAGCGVVPIRYRDKSFVNAMQWVVGLETFLLVEDPWRMFLTTDHPNGAPFYTYPHLIRLLMDKGFRDDMLQKINPDAAAMSILPTITRQYSLDEIAIITRAGPARSLGLRDRGHLGVGACADITVYRDKSFVNAMQWVVGLETFLLVEDPWRMFLTTDHPNGAPFYTYPHLIRLLMDRGFRNDMLQKINPDAAAMSILPTITREYSLDEIAILTRAGPARSLGLVNRGHLGIGASADITVYKDDADREAMFKTPELVFKNGELIVKNGKVVKVVHGATHVVRPNYDQSIERPLEDYFSRFHTVAMENFKLPDDEIIDGGQGSLIVQPTRQ